jgi:hypothetical protein
MTEVSQASTGPVPEPPTVAPPPRAVAGAVDRCHPETRGVTGVVIGLWVPVQ